MSESNVLLVAVERCSLCGRSRKQFTCSRCVNTGNFNYSNTQFQDHASYAVKCKRLKVVCAVRNATLQRLEPGLQNLAARKEKHDKIILLRSRVDSLRDAIECVKELDAKQKDVSSKKVAKIEQQKKFITRLKEKTEKLRNGKRLQEKKVKYEQHVQRLQVKENELRQLRCYHVQTLLEDIFPLSQRDIYPEFGTPPLATYSSEIAIPEVVSEGTSSPELELEDATRTVHVGGKWISQSVEQTEHTIIDVGMPASGDFMKYYEWLWCPFNTSEIELDFYLQKLSVRVASRFAEGLKTGAHSAYNIRVKSYRNEPKNPELYSNMHSNRVLSIPASLIYTAQLCDISAYFLDVSLPYRIEYNHFGLLHVPRQRLFRTVNKLMENVMHLCFSQMIPLTSLKPYQPIRNLQTCLSSSNDHLGRFGWFDTFEFEVGECPFDSDSSAEELNYESDEDSYSGEKEEEWDRLMDLPNDPRYVQYDSSTTISLDQSEARSLSSSASGLVTSAAASVASALWPWKR